MDSGDKNTSFFHNTIKKHINRNRIASITCSDGSTTMVDSDIKEKAVKFFDRLLGSSSEVLSFSVGSLCTNRLSEEVSVGLGRNASEEEIKSVCFSLKPNKAPGPDGFNAYFFHKAWPWISPLITKAVAEFFRTGRLLSQFNSTIITLVPKVMNLSNMGEFRPISCCNTVYKVISKVIANRIKGCLPSLISHSQVAFVEGRRIGDNILLVQELLRGYHLNHGSPRCTMKIDILKAYDSLDWSFLLEVLSAFNFPPCMIMWIRAYITSPRYSVAVNGELVGFFPGRRGLRQGDPLSLYLFVMAMEIFSIMVNNAVDFSLHFCYHWRCEKIKLTHIAFADDLLVFCHGSMDSICVLIEVVWKFSYLSGLVPNQAKSCIFLAGTLPGAVLRIQEYVGFSLGSLPFKYLGVPLITSKVGYTDCVPLLEKVNSRIRSWEHRFLSFAGRLTLIQFVLCSLQVYWAAHLFLPKKILVDIECKIRLFCGLVRSMVPILRRLRGLMFAALRRKGG